MNRTSNLTMQSRDSSFGDENDIKTVTGMPTSNPDEQSSKRDNRIQLRDTRFVLSHQSPAEISLFSDVRAAPGPSPFADKHTQRVIRNRNRLIAEKSPESSTSVAKYAPYAQVKNNTIRARLLEIAQKFRFVDTCFAEYYQIVVHFFDASLIRQSLEAARNKIAATQPGVDDPDSVYLGDLGHFCEEVARRRLNFESKPVKYTITAGNHREILQYLQDASEVHYWEITGDLFFKWRANNKTLSSDLVLRVLHDVKIEVLGCTKRLREALQGLQGERSEDIAPIMEGIDSRIRVLDGFWDLSTSSIEQAEAIAAVFSSTQSISTHETTPRVESKAFEERNVTPILIGLVLLFLIGAILPGYRAFEISSSKKGPGSTDEADFWYLIQNTIMALGANAAIIVPLLTKSWLSASYFWMWTFQALALAFYMLSIGIYTRCNTRWSSAISFLGSVASAGSVIAIIHAAGKELKPTKSKQE